MSLNSVNGLLLKKMIIAGANELNDNKQLVDSLNVFPVPDGDTGTNMSLTAIAAAKECEKTQSLSISDMANASASGSLRGARGNSGVILSQLFRGFSKGLDSIEEANTLELAVAFRKGVETAYKAVMKPKEGTILTVARACAEAAEKYSQETDDIEVFLTKIIEEGNEMLLKTKDMLPVLKQADVVDAGGKGLLCILVGALKSINANGDIILKEATESTTVDFSALTSVNSGEITFGYCTEFFIIKKDAHEDTVNALKTYLSNIGDSIVVIADEEIIKVHVHTDHPGKAIEKALTIGALSGIKIDNMRIQHTNIIDFAKKEEKEVPHKDTCFVSISMGSGFSEIFTKLGVDKIIEGGQTMNPSTEDILNAIEKLNCTNVVILPNNKNIILAAEQAAKLTTDKKVFVIPTHSVPEGIAAIIGFEHIKPIEEAVSIMNENITLVTTCSVTYAVRDTILGEKNIKENDILCMLGGKIEIVSKDIVEGTTALMEKAVKDDSEVISIYYGCDVTKEDAEEMESLISEAYPHCDVELLQGNQPLYYYIISVE